MAIQIDSSLQNFAAGELSPKFRGRFDLKAYFNGAQRFENFIAETQGAARFRTGLRFVIPTRRNNIANLFEFQFNDEQAYILEFTEKFIRFYTNEGIIVEDDIVITGATQANPVVITAVANGYSDGDEIFIKDIVGTTELNGKNFLVKNSTANTFEITDIDGVDIDGTLFTAYVSGGVAQRIVEIASPYREADLFDLQFAQSGDVLYIVHNNYQPRKLTRSSNTSWDLSIFIRINDPFLLALEAITNITQANPAVVSSPGHGLNDGDKIIIDTVVGMTEVNGGLFTVANTTGGSYELLGVDSTSFNAYISDGYAALRNNIPGVIAFYESRLVYGRTRNMPQTLWFSRAVDDTGAPRYDDFTTGTNPDDAVFTTLASETDEPATIKWLAPNSKFLATGTFGGVYKVVGNGQDQIVTATEGINTKILDYGGVSSAIPAKVNNVLIYALRNKLNIKSLEFDVLSDSFRAFDRNLIADHITIGNLKQMRYQSGRPDIVWSIKDNGELIGLTFQTREEISGWHRHNTGDKDDKFISIGIIPQPDKFDQVWFVIQRKVNGVTRHYVEFFEDEPVVPEFIDFFTGGDNEASDTRTFENAMFETQKKYIHLDSTLSFDGSVLGVSAGAGLTPAAVTGSGINFTASAPVFTSDDVGRELWKKAMDGVGEGRAEITSFTSSTIVVCKIKKDFDNTDTMAAGDWYLTTNAVFGIDHLEGETVGVVADGSVHPDRTVVDGAIALDLETSVVHAGLRYPGILKSMPLEVGSANGPAQTKDQNITELGIRFLNTLGASYGTDIYKMEKVLFRSTNSFTNRPPPLFSGSKRVYYPDSWEKEKFIIVEQQQPLPCVVQYLILYMSMSVR